MYKVKFFITVSGGPNLERKINDWLEWNTNVEPINITINDDCDQAILLYKEAKND